MSSDRAVVDENAKGEALRAPLRHALFAAHRFPSSAAHMMRRPNATQVERAKRMLAHELSRGAADDAQSAAAAAGRLLETIHAQLDPLIGSSGVNALLVRSATVANRAFTLAIEVGDATSCRDSLLGHGSAIAGDAAAHLFATFFALLATLIGERMTSEVLRVWPVEEPPKESKP